MIPKTLAQFALSTTSCRCLGQTRSPPARPCSPQTDKGAMASCATGCCARGWSRMRTLGWHCEFGWTRRTAPCHRHAIARTGSRSGSIEGDCRGVRLLRHAVHHHRPHRVSGDTSRGRCAADHRGRTGGIACLRRCPLSLRPSPGQTHPQRCRAATITAQHTRRHSEPSQRLRCQGNGNQPTIRSPFRQTAFQTACF